MRLSYSASRIANNLSPHARRYAVPRLPDQIIPVLRERSFVTPSIAAPFSGQIIATPAAVTPEPVPEPGTFALLGTGLAGLAGVARRKLAA
jgi:hypothetical protein